MDDPLKESNSFRNEPTFPRMNDPQERLQCSPFAEVEREASTAGWDGQGALPIRQDSLTAAKVFYTALPDDLPSPDVRPHPDGDVALTWNFAADRVLTVSFTTPQQFAYAGLRGKSTIYGTEDFSDGAFPPILDAFLRSCAEAPPTTVSLAQTS